ncbi:MAG: dethiobiotin synthase [Polyangiaceae bacterium]
MRVVVVGTGTEVGKTFVATALAAAFRRAGWRTAGVKPVESGGGLGGWADAAALASAAGGGPGRPLYGFVPPLSPHLAARRAGDEVQIASVVGWVDRMRDERVVVETAGGLLTPLSDSATNLSLVEALMPCRLVVVASDRLGVLHDVGCVRAVLRERGLWAQAVVVLSAPAVADASTGTNGPELVRLGWCAAVVVAGRDEDVGDRVASALEG